ncbi:MAG TPA: PEP-CTERM sorting domain-containing protein [Terriglobia bacterium]|nr:PEP-CTERM sorting domain-containing protein [Terriglobia bacterium]
MKIFSIIKSAFFLSACILALVGATATSVFANTVTVKLTGVNGAAQGGVYVDPYSGTINGSSPLTLVCDDFAHETRIGESWTATVSDFSDLSSARFQQGSAAATLRSYDEAAYLYNALLSHPSEYGDISFAIWGLFTPSAQHSSGFTSNSAFWLGQAESQVFTPGEFSNFIVLTPTNSRANSAQEFITATPEPGTMVLMITGLIAGCLLFEKKRLAA